MAIKKAVKTTPAAEADFIAAAPDATVEQEQRRGVIRGKKQQITLTLPPDMLPRIDEAAGALGISRAAWITLNISKALKQEQQ